MQPPVQRHVFELTTNYPTVSVQSVNSLNIPCASSLPAPGQEAPSTYAGVVSSEPHSVPVSASFASLSGKIRGCLLGGALGDAFANPVPPRDAAGLGITADTQLALYSLDGLQEAIEWANQGLGADETACIWLAYLRWLRSRGLPLPEAGLVPQPRAIDAEPLLRSADGAADAAGADPEVLAALSTGEMATRQRPVNTENSSAAPLVRSAPFGLLPYVGAETVYKLSLDAASLTHGHPASRHAAAVFASTVHGLLAPGATLRGAAEAATEQAALVASDDGGSPELVKRLQAVLAGTSVDGTVTGEDTRPAAAEDALALGLEIALAAADSSVPDSAGAIVPAAVRQAALRGGAPAAVVAGSMLGTLYGPSALPDADALREHSAIEKIAGAFAATTIAP
nr:MULTISPECIES: ADP-ribosylglycohydrolase family protein [unclassified Arthrobacter]